MKKDYKASNNVANQRILAPITSSSNADYPTSNQAVLDLVVYTRQTKETSVPNYFVDGLLEYDEAHTHQIECVPLIYYLLWLA